MVFLTKGSLLLMFGVLVNLQNVNGFHPNVGLDEYQIMTKYGYPYEKHYVTTEDGYILEMSRVLPRSLKDSANSSIPFKIYPNLMSTTPGEPVLLMHGLTVSGREFLMNDADKALVFVLVNHGYDVFIGNARGVTRSRNHTTLDPDLDAEKFWDFSWHEIGVYDQPAMIKRILTLTGFKKVSYIGHSQGGTSFLTMTAVRPETNSMIKTAFLFGGTGIMKYGPRPILKRFSAFERELQAMFKRLQIYEVLRYASLVMNIVKIMTDTQFGLREITMRTLNSLDFVTTYHMDVELLPVVATSVPSGASCNQFFHYAQSIKHGDFRFYDYVDKDRNLEKYGSIIPPRYNLSAITSKTVMYYSDYDVFINRKDVQLMTKQMPNAVSVNVKVKKFSHADFVLSRLVNDVVFKDVLWRLRNA